MHSGTLDGQLVGRAFEKRFERALREISAISRSVAETVLPYYLARKGLVWTPSSDDQSALGTFDVGSSAFQALGMLRRSKFFRDLLADLSDGGGTNRATRHPNLVCHLDDFSFIDVAHADERTLARIDELAAFLASLPTSHRVFEGIELFVPERHQIALCVWRRILPLCHSRNISIYGHAPSSVHDGEASAFPAFCLPSVRRLYISHLAFSQSHWRFALSSIRCPSLEAVSVSTQAPISAVTEFLSHHSEVDSIRSIRYLPGSTTVEATTFQSISLPDLRTLYGCHERVAPLLGVIDSKANIKNVHLDSVHGTYRTWFEGVLRCIPNQDLQMLSIGYVGPKTDEGAPGMESAMSRFQSEILPRRLRRYEQNQLDYMSINLTNVSKQDAQVSLTFSQYIQRANYF